MSTEIKIDPQITKIGPTPEGHTIHATLLVYDGFNVYLQEKSPNGSGGWRSQIMEFENEEDAFYARRVWADFINGTVAEFSQEDIDYLEKENSRLKNQVADLSMLVKRVRNRTKITNDLLEKCDHLLLPDAFLRTGDSKTPDATCV